MVMVMVMIMVMIMTMVMATADTSPDDEDFVTAIACQVACQRSALDTVLQRLHCIHSWEATTTEAWAMGMAMAAMGMALEVTETALESGSGAPLLFLMPP